MSSTNGREPELSQGNRPYAAPMLGGDRAVMVPCEACGGPTIRDFFGNWVCLDCITIKQSFISKGRSSDCAWCGHKKLMPLLYDEFINEFSDLEPVIHYPGEFYGAYWCQRCYQCHFVYRENNRLRVEWIDSRDELINPMEYAPFHAGEE